MSYITQQGAEQEGMIPAMGCVSCGGFPLAYALTYDDACSQARNLLGGFDSRFLTMPCDQIAAHIAGDCTLFVPPSQIRDALAPGTCGSTPPPGPPPPGPGPGPGPGPAPTPGADTNLLLGIVGIAAVAGIALAITASSRKKKVLIAG